MKGIREAERRMFTLLGAVIISLLFVIVPVSRAFSQRGLTLSGRVYNGVTRQPVDFGTVVILEERLKTRTDAGGNYRITVPRAGTYTVIVQSSGLRVARTTIRIEKDSIRDFYLSAVTIKGGALTITGERDIQKISRHTMTQQNLKEVPGTFGDSVNALTALPGVIRTAGFFGPLVIRGAPEIFNQYYIDDIPIYSPLHYGGLHSVINNNIISEIDLYSSSFPALFGAAAAAVINITTVDSVKEFGGYTDISLLSANVLVQTPIYRSDSYNPDKKENAGYFIVSGRYGYIGLIVPYLVDRNTYEITPEYWDYQAKMKYYFTSRHAVTLLFMGSKDFLRIRKKKKDEDEPGEDPLLRTMQWKIDQTSHNQGIYYTYVPSKRFQNKLVAFSALRESYLYLNLPEEGVADWGKDVHITSRPNIFGLKDKIRFEWWENHAELRTAIEYTLYYFTAHGKSYMLNTFIEGDEPDFADPDVLSNYMLDERIINHVIGGYAENKFTFGGLTLVPGVRADYLKSAHQTTVDPRGMVSYEFSSGTTISAAGGWYSYYIQINPFIFDQWPDVAGYGDALKPQRAIHRTLGIEQKIDLFTVKVEGFYNTFWNVAEAWGHLEPDGTYLPGLCNGRLKARGFELMLRKDKREEGLFGWLSYTYTRSDYKTGLPTEAGYGGHPENQAGDPYGNRWFPYFDEQRHALKLILGYTLGRHTLSSKFQYYTSFPYTPIVGADEDMNYAALNPGEHRFYPEYGERNSKHFDPHHRLDLRYSFKRLFSWGYISFYVEVLNVYNNKPKNEQQWDYRYDYSADNPEIGSDDEDIFEGIMPNIGVEIKF